jgi:radical SAM superfamily enzyme YgiQ (UPF0313 family)
MVGNPGETLEDLEMTGRLLKKIRPDFYAAYYTTPFPGTGLYEEAVKRGLIGGAERYWHQDETPVPLSCVDRDVLEKYVSRFTRLNIVKNYLFNPVFLFDMFRFSVSNPALALRIVANLASGNSKKALTLIADSVYFRKQENFAS